MKPRLTKGPASAYEESHEVIREFGGEGASGGLLSLTQLDDGRLVVDLYRLAGNVEVRVGTLLDDNGAATLALSRENLLELLRQATTMDPEARELVTALGRRLALTEQHAGTEPEPGH